MPPKGRALPYRLLFGVLALTALLLAVSLALALRPDPDPVSAGKTLLRTPAIVFVCGRDGHNLCRVDPSGRGLEQLTRDGTEEAPYASPSLTPDGRWLAFVHGGRAYLASTSNLNTRLLLDNSGDSVAVTLRDDARAALVTREVVECYGSDETGACTSVATLVVLSTEGGKATVLDKKREAGHADWLDDVLISENWAIGLEKLYLLPVTTGPPGPPEPLPQSYLIEVAEGREMILRPEVSPDGSLIAATLFDGGWEKSTIALFSRSGEFVRVLDKSTLSVDPSWSPDSRQLVFTRSAWLYTAAASGGEATSLDVRGREPTWGG